MPIRLRIFLNTLAILLLGMGLAGMLSWRAVEQLYLDTQRENLLAQATMSAAALQGQALPFDSQPYSQTSNTLPGIHTRLLSDQGVLIQLPLNEIFAPPAENSIPISAQELQQRPEIVQAMLGQPASAIRVVLDRQVLYAAAPILDQAGVISGLVYLAMPLPQGGLPVNLLLELAAAVGAAVILASLAGVILARQITTPLEQVSLAAESVNLTQPVPTHSGIREVDSLGRAFNQMTKSVSQSVQAQNAFVADVAHELRTPLTVISGTIETLQDGALDDLQGRGPLLDSMQRETGRLVRLVNELLVLTRADAGMLALQLQPLDLVSLVRVRCEQLSTLAALRRVKFVVESTAACMVMADADRLAQVLDNLLENASRYSPENSSVLVDVLQMEGECICAVMDSGPGIPNKDLPFIFERFYRADSSRNRQTGGAGLGLAIARSLVQAQGGHILAESEPGKGTTMTFRMPALNSGH